MISHERLTRSFKRGLRFLGVGAIAIALMPQIVATIQPAMAVSQTCSNFGGGTLTVLSTTGQDSGITLANGSSVTLSALFNNTGARGVVFTVTGPATSAAVGTFKDTITRTGTGTITVRVTFSDPSGNTYAVTYLIN